MTEQVVPESSNSENNIEREQADKTGRELQRHLKGPIYVLLSDLSRARQTTELLTKNLTQDITITYNDILQEVGLIRIDTSLTRDEDQFLSKRHYQQAKDPYNF